MVPIETHTEQMFCIVHIDMSQGTFLFTIVEIISVFVETKGPSSAQNSLLVLSAGRFRGDLDILAAEGFRLVILDYNWM